MHNSTPLFRVPLSFSNEIGTLNPQIKKLTLSEFQGLFFQLLRANADSHKGHSTSIESRAVALSRAFLRIRDAFVMQLALLLVASVFSYLGWAYSWLPLVLAILTLGVFLYGASVWHRILVGAVIKENFIASTDIWLQFLSGLPDKDFHEIMAWLLEVHPTFVSIFEAYRGEKS